MKVAITLNKTELESLAVIAESKELRKVIKNLLGVKPKKTSYSPVEKLSLMFNKPVSREWNGLVIRFTKTTLSITGDIEIISLASSIIEILSSKKSMNQMSDAIASRVAESNKTIEFLEAIVVQLDGLATEARFVQIMSE